MAVLHEVPGASERPSGCEITLTEEGDAVTITIPARGAHPMMILAACLLTICLAIVMALGILLFFFNKNVLGADHIGSPGMPTYMRPYKYFFILLWIMSESIGVLSLLTIARNVFASEQIRIDSEGVSHKLRFFGKSRGSYALRAEIQGFHLKQDPLGFQVSELNLQVRGERIQIAEYTREADRQWLASVGNALLGRL